MTTPRTRGFTHHKTWNPNGSPLSRAYNPIRWHFWFPVLVLENWAAMKWIVPFWEIFRTWQSREICLYTPELRRPSFAPPTKALPLVDWVVNAAAGTAAKRNAVDWNFMVAPIQLQAEKCRSMVVTVALTSFSENPWTLVVEKGRFSMMISLLLCDDVGEKMWTRTMTNALELENISVFKENFNLESWSLEYKI